MPTVWAPLPLHMFLLLWFVGPLTMLLPPIFFWTWSNGLFTGQADVPRRSLIATGVLAVLSVVYYVGSWPYGVKYQGRIHTIAVGVATLMFLIALGALAVVARRQPSWAKSLAFHWLLFLWFCWYAFPYLGELP
jgi:hypothetical protein